MSEPNPADNATRKSPPRVAAPETLKDAQTGAWIPAHPAIQSQQPPHRIGRFEVRRLLGEGAFARVYLGFDPELEREVAIKVPKADALTPELRDTFLRENRLAAIIHHPNICPIYDVGSDDGLPYIVMRMVPSTLAGLLKRLAAPLPPRNAVAIARKLALGLVAAHAQKVIHRDLKPANVLYDEVNREVLIADFGLARFADQASEASNGVPKGTPAYMAPEQARGLAAVIGPLSDVYSLGIILYEMLVGRVPFTGESVWEVMRDHCETTPIPPSAAHPGLDPRVDALCLKALAKHPADRYPSAKAFAAALADYLRTSEETPAVNVVLAEEPPKPKPSEQQPNKAESEAEPIFEIVQLPGASIVAPPKPVPPPLPSPRTEPDPEPEPRRPIAHPVPPDEPRPRAVPVAQPVPSPRPKRKRESELEDDSEPRTSTGTKVFWVAFGCLLLAGLAVGGTFATGLWGKKKPDPSSEVASSDPNGKKDAPVSPPPEDSKLKDTKVGQKEPVPAIKDPPKKNPEPKKPDPVVPKPPEPKKPDPIDAELLRDWAELKRVRLVLGGPHAFYTTRGPLRYLAWKKAAEANSAIGMVLYGRCLLDGLGVAKDEVAAAKLYRQAADLGEPLAMNNLGVCYGNGTGVLRDEREAAKWYRKAAELDEPLAMRNLADYYVAGRGVEKDQKEAARWYRKAADHGDPGSMTEIGICYEFGTGVLKDEKEAVWWYRKAANLGHTRAITCLGHCYLDGKGVTKDEKEARAWYEKSAAQGDADAQNNLGTLYYNNTGVTRDFVKARQWFEKAAAQGDKYAQSNLGIVYEFGSGVPQDWDRAMEWYRKSADQGYEPAKKAVDRLEKIEADFDRGFDHHLGLGGKEDFGKARQFYEKAAAQGHVEAQFQLASLYFEGKGGPRDYVKAKVWCEKAAEKGHVEAQFQLAALLYKGEGGVALDYPSAKKWCEKAAEKGHIDAQVQLALMYESGTGVAVDLTSALAWYRKAAAQGNETAKSAVKRLEK